MRRTGLILLLTSSILLSSCATLGGESGSQTPPTHAQTDFDGDGVVDWQDADDDNDGVSDVDELSAGSDPRDPNSLPEG